MHVPVCMYGTTYCVLAGRWKRGGGIGLVAIFRSNTVGGGSAKFWSAGLENRWVRWDMIWCGYFGYEEGVATTKCPIVARGAGRGIRIFIAGPGTGRGRLGAVGYHKLLAAIQGMLLMGCSKGTINARQCIPHSRGGRLTLPMQVCFFSQAQVRRGKEREKKRKKKKKEKGCRHPKMVGTPPRREK